MSSEPGTDSATMATVADEKNAQDVVDQVDADNAQDAKKKSDKGPIPTWQLILVAVLLVAIAIGIVWWAIAASNDCCDDPCCPDDDCGCGDDCDCDDPCDCDECSDVQVQMNVSATNVDGGGGGGNLTEINKPHNNKGEYRDQQRRTLGIKRVKKPKSSTSSAPTVTKESLRERRQKRRQQQLQEQQNQHQQEQILVSTVSAPTYTGSAPTGVSTKLRTRSARARASRMMMRRSTNMLVDAAACCGKTGPTGPRGDHYATVTTDCLNVFPSEDDTVTVNVQPGLAYTVGQMVLFGNDILHYLQGTVVSYDNVTGELTFTVTFAVGGGATGPFCNQDVNVSGALGANGPTGAQGVAGPTGGHGPTGPTGRGRPGCRGPRGCTGARGPTGRDGPTGYTGQQGPVGPASVLEGADFYATMTGDDVGTITGLLGVVQFPHDGPSYGTAVQRQGLSTSSFLLQAIGTYEVSWTVPVTEAGQLVLALDTGSGPVAIPYTLIGRAATNTPITNTVWITNSLVGSILSLRNPGASALTMTSNAGGTSATNAHLVIKLIARP